TAAAGKSPPGCRKLTVLFLKAMKAFIATMARIDVENKQAISTDTEIGIWRLAAKPQLDDRGFSGAAKKAIGGDGRSIRGIGKGMLGGVRRAINPLGAGADQPAVAGDGPVQRNDGMAVAHPGEGVGQNAKASPPRASGLNLSTAA